MKFEFFWNFKNVFFLNWAVAQVFLGFRLKRDPFLVKWHLKYWKPRLALRFAGSRKSQKFKKSGLDPTSESIILPWHGKHRLFMPFLCRTNIVLHLKGQKSLCPSCPTEFLTCVYRKIMKNAKNHHFWLRFFSQGQHPIFSSNSLRHAIRCIFCNYERKSLCNWVFDPKKDFRKKKSDVFFNLGHILPCGNEKRQWKKSFRPGLNWWRASVFDVSEVISLCKWL